MYNFYGKYQIMIDNFINKNLDDIKHYCRLYKINYIDGNINHKLDIEYFFINLPNNLKDNYDFFLDAVKYNGNLIKYASNNLKNNCDIVLTAIENNISALYYTSYNLKNNYNFILAAVGKNGHSLAYASDNLKNNYNIALTAILNNHHTVSYLSKKIIKNRKLILNMNNSKNSKDYYFSFHYENEIMKTIDYKFKIKKNILLDEKLNRIFLYF